MGHKKNHLGEYYKGQKIRPFGKFTKFDDSAGSPTTVVLNVINPLEAATTPTVTDNKNPKTDLAETGTYFAEISLNEVGAWKGQWLGTGAIEAAEEWTLRVLPTEF